MQNINKTGLKDELAGIESIINSELSSDIPNSIEKRIEKIDLLKKELDRGYKSILKQVSLKELTKGYKLLNDKSGKLQDLLADYVLTDTNLKDSELYNYLLESSGVENDIERKVKEFIDILLNKLNSWKKNYKEYEGILSNISYYLYRKRGDRKIALKGKYAGAGLYIKNLESLGLEGEYVGYISIIENVDEVVVNGEKMLREASIIDSTDLKMEGKIDTDIIMQDVKKISGKISFDDSVYIIMNATKGNMKVDLIITSKNEKKALDLRLEREKPCYVYGTIKNDGKLYIRRGDTSTQIDPKQIVTVEEGNLIIRPWRKFILF